MINLYTLLSRARPKYTTHERHAINRQRRACINALLVDETRAWLDVGCVQPDVLNGLGVMLLFACHANAYDGGQLFDGVMRDGLKTAALCAECGAVIAADDAQRLSAAAQQARTVLAAASLAAIVHAGGRVKSVVALTA